MTRAALVLLVVGTVTLGSIGWAVHYKNLAQTEYQRGKRDADRWWQSRPSHEAIRDRIEPCVGCFPPYEGTSWNGDMIPEEHDKQRETLPLEPPAAMAQQFPALPPCAFGLSRITIQKAVKEVPSIGDPKGPFTLIYIPQPTRQACPYELAVAKYGDERVRYVPGVRPGFLRTIPCDPPQPKDSYIACIHPDDIARPAKVEVCDEDGKDCTTVYTEPNKP